MQIIFFKKNRYKRKVNRYKAINLSLQQRLLFSQEEHLAYAPTDFKKCGKTQGNHILVYSVNFLHFQVTGEHEICQNSY